MRDDLTDRKFGRLTVVQKNPVAAKNRDSRWDCVCECGTTLTVIRGSLTSGNTISCGCYRKEVSTATQTSHGMSDSTEYRIWQMMVARCTNPNMEAYANYGGRGIKVCWRWIDSFENFFMDMGPRPSLEHTLDREENDGNYEPGNCRWATPLEQANNRRSNVFYEFNGVKKTIAEWSREYNVDQKRLRNRLVNLGWDFDRAIKTP